MAAQPGHTKDLQSIQLERGMRIIDSPGVVFDEDDFIDGKSEKKSSVLLRNVVKVEDVEDPIAVGQFPSTFSWLNNNWNSGRNSGADTTRHLAKDIQPS